MVSFRIIALSIIILTISACKDRAPEPLNESIPEYTRTMNLEGWETKISSLNVWGLPVLSTYKKERMPAIGHALKERQSDFGFIQEAWTGEGRQDIFSNSHFKHAHFFSVAFTMGSGLQMLSIQGFERHAFREFTLGGKISNITDGEALAGKGVGMSRVTLKSLPVSMFNTHLVARQTPGTETTLEDNYTPQRLMQLFEVFQHLVEQTDSDAFIVVGDFNMRWMHREYEFWNNLTSLDGLKAEEQDHDFCTSCPDNSFRNSGVNNGQVDYIFVSPRLSITGAFRDFDQRIQGEDGTSINLSDHYGWTSTIGPVPSLSNQNPEIVRTRVKESLDYLKLRLEDYLTWHDKKDEGPETQNLPDKLCQECLIKDSIKSVKRYQDALAAPNPGALPKDLKRIRTRLESYFQIFR